jgi:subtilisin family serine protease
MVRSPHPPPCCCSWLASRRLRARQNIRFVAAAGNGGSDDIGNNNDLTPSLPSKYSTTAQAGYDAIISVAALTSSRFFSPFSNYGLAGVDLGVPGAAIYSPVAGGGYGTFSGTSIATPHVAGFIALYSVMSGQSPTDIKTTLLAFAMATNSLEGRQSLAAVWTPRPSPAGRHPQWLSRRTLTAHKPKISMFAAWPT